MKASYEVHSMWEDELGNTISRLDISVSVEGSDKNLERIKNIIDTICLTTIDIVDDIET